MFSLDNQNLDYKTQFETAVSSKNSELQISILKKALEENGINSDIMADLALSVANHGLPFINFLEAFCDSNPNMPHYAEIKLADHYAGMDKLDQTTARARQFLSKMRGSEGEKNPGSFPNLLNLIARSYLLMTAAYTRLGARSYSKRLLEKALRLPLSQPFAERMKQEIETLGEELKSADATEINSKWEDFFLQEKILRGFLICV